MHGGPFWESCKFIIGVPKAASVFPLILPLLSNFISVMGHLNHSGIQKTFDAGVSGLGSPQILYVLSLQLYFSFSVFLTGLYIFKRLSSLICFAQYFFPLTTGNQS